MELTFILEIGWFLIDFPKLDFKKLEIGYKIEF